MPIIVDAKGNQSSILDPVSSKSPHLTTNHSKEYWNPYKMIEGHKMLALGAVAIGAYLYSRR
jgi:hypothetical protein